VTTVVPEIVDSVGYSARDGFKRTRVHTAIGEEAGYALRVAEFVVLGVTMTSFPVNVFDLGHENIDGLLGMNFLSEFNYEVRSAERRILVEMTSEPTMMCCTNTGVSQSSAAAGSGSACRPRRRRPRGTSRCTLAAVRGELVDFGTRAARSGPGASTCCART